MITKRNLSDALQSLGFKKEGKVLYKVFPEYGVSMSADLDKKILIYPEAIKGRERNRTFDDPENFVVFECVNRLLEKGYRPEDIELERQWNLGHTVKGGRADICVSDRNDQMLFIIECKTWGREFNKAKRDTLNDGAQLFSYWQQEASCRWMMLYASDFEDGSVRYKEMTISCIDDPNIVLLAKQDESIHLYKDSSTVIQRYETWKETYALQTYDEIIFSDESVAYEIGVEPLRKKNLLDFTPDDKIVNQFEEILRHNNVSDKENAFNRLIALFICKLVDEITKNEDDVVEFQYKPGTDTYESLQDRLQRLHRDGMEKFMREKIYYVPADYPEWLFSNYTGKKRQKAIEDLQNTIRILKFYSNNDFAFKDVHNEELFYQNGKILVEMVQLFEKYRIVYPSKHQFLGDLFEQLLNKGFKQNEGQFFTPMPITRFVWDSLPVAKLIENERGMTHPKVIDFACGAGHFLTEAVETINYHTGETNDNGWARDYIYGIEKDYRLARVAKISLFMNGAGGGNIIFGDGLDNSPDKGIENGAFDVLVANPPYSVKDFKQHLVLKNNSLDLLNGIGLSGSEIEVLFVERIAQLLKPGGIAAVILPSSLLTNDGSSYESARGQIIDSFKIRAIAAFGSCTFSETGTNTVIVFLEKYNEPPKRRELLEDSVTSILMGEDFESWEEAELISDYSETIGVDIVEYLDVVTGNAKIDDLRTSDYWKRYIDCFENSSNFKRVSKSRRYVDGVESEKSDIYLSMLLKNIVEVERNKLICYGLLRNQKTVIVTSPESNADQKEFLGYKWSKAKGNEGIQIVHPGGMLYEDSDRDAVGTIAAAIRSSFDDEEVVLGDNIYPYTKYVMATELVDFSRPDFKQIIDITESTSKETRSKYPMKPLGSVCDVRIGATPKRRIYRYFEGNNPWVTIKEMKGQVITDTKERITDEAVANSSVKLIPKGTTLLSFKLSIGKTAVAGCDLYTNEAIAGLIPTDENSVTNEYLFCLFNSNLIDLTSVGHKAFGKSLNSQYLNEEVLIPIPPKKVQSALVKAFNQLRKTFDSTGMSEEEYHDKVAELFDKQGVILSD